MPVVLMHGCGIHGPMLLVIRNIAAVGMRVVGHRAFIGLKGDTVRADVLDNQVEHASGWIDAAKTQAFAVLILITNSTSVGR
jgi:hypothetical protein